jgi:hypothetical protein
MYKMCVWTAFETEGYYDDMSKYGKVIEYSNGIMQTHKPHEKRFPVTPDNLRAAWGLSAYLHTLNYLAKRSIENLFGHDSSMLEFYWENICKAIENKDEKAAQKWYDEATEHFEYYRKKYTN